MTALIYHLQLQTPVLISRPGAGEENSDRSYPFITGSAIRGALVSRYLSKYGADEHFPRRFLSGEVRFLNAYPIYGDHRMLPAPLSWHVAKNATDKEKTRAFDFVHGIPDKQELKNPKTLGEDFVAPTETGFVRVTTPMQVTVHNVSHERGVKKKGTSSLFQYEAIAAGHRFAGVILGKKDDLIEMQELLQQRSELWLGGSRNAGYGRTIILETAIEETDNWTEVSGWGQSDLHGCVVITLLSDAIVRDTYGSYSVHPQDLIGISPKTVYMRTRVVGGFNRTWGLPLVQAAAFQMGSVFVYDTAAMDENMTEQLGRWQREGLGERRTEGFGRIAVNWLPGYQFDLDKEELPKAAQHIQETPTLDEESKKLAELMVQRRYRSLLDQRLMTVLSRLRIEKRGLSNAQMNKLRRVLRQVQRDKSWEPLIHHLNHLNADARKQMERSRIDGKKFMKWLESAERDELWKHYFAQEELPVIAGVQAQADDGLKRLYQVRLIDALLQRATKE